MAHLLGDEEQDAGAIAASFDPDWLRPVWAASQGHTPARVGSVMTTRAGGVSAAPWQSLNLGMAVGDDPAAVMHNRARLARATGARHVFMKQVHGTRVLHLRAAHVRPGSTVEEADACVTTEPGLACTVQVADCLPALFNACDGRAIGAAHAGWRGLAGGILESTLAAVCARAECAPHQVEVWLGACIGPERFEVGSEVAAAFGAFDRPATAAYFNAQRPGKWLADLAGLARARLIAAGAGRVTGGDGCTASDASRFFSFRRDGVTGRMAAAIWIAPR